MPFLQEFRPTDPQSINIVHICSVLTTVNISVTKRICCQLLIPLKSNVSLALAKLLTFQGLFRIFNNN